MQNPTPREISLANLTLALVHEVYGHRERHIVHEQDSDLYERLHVLTAWAETHISFLRRILGDEPCDPLRELVARTKNIIAAAGDDERARGQ